MTLRQAPGETEVESHSLLLRAGYVRQLAAGIFSYLPLAWRSLRKIEQILREEMDRIDGQELSMPVVHPAELWQATGRWYDFDATMTRFVDRRERDMLLAVTHEEVVAFHAASEIQSYRQLPAMVYHMQTKFRDELRSRGGLIRVREFIMKDSYSLDRDPAGLVEQYERHYEAYERIGRRCALPLTAVRSDTGMMGGKVAHEFMYVSPVGEDSLALCDACGYSANREVAEFTLEPTEGEAREMERVHTPGTSTIQDLTALLGISAAETAKMVFYVGSFREEDGGRVERLVAAIVRGDLDANPIQVQNLSGALELRPAHEEEIAAAGMVPGFASPVGVDPGAALFVVDHWVAASPNLVLGANETDYHLRNVCCGPRLRAHGGRAGRRGVRERASAGAAVPGCGWRAAWRWGTSSSSAPATPTAWMPRSRTRREPNVRSGWGRTGSGSAACSPAWRRSTATTTASSYRSPSPPFTSRSWCWRARRRRGRPRTGCSTSCARRASRCSTTTGATSVRG